jgi:hypothetical protein
MPQTALVELPTGAGQGSKSWRWENQVAVAHGVLDVTIAAVAGVVSVSILFPLYLVVALGKRVVRRITP